MTFDKEYHTSTRLTEDIELAIDLTGRQRRLPATLTMPARSRGCPRL